MICLYEASTWNLRHRYFRTCNRDLWVPLEPPLPAKGVLTQEVLGFRVQGLGSRNSWDLPYAAALGVLLLHGDYFDALVALLTTP